MFIPLIAAALATQEPPPLRVNPTGEEHAIYRKVQPGETRSEGLLRRIVCPGRGPISLVVKQQDTVVQYTAPQLSSVDFIVYDRTFKGPVSCEGFGDGKRVYVTWKTDGKNKRAIAIEFLPK